MSPRNTAVLWLWAAALSACALGAGNDNDVQWDGIFSDPFSRVPLHPGKGEDFTVELRVLRGDITGAFVRTWDGAEHLYPMAWVRNEGPYDIWRGRVGGTAADFLYWRFRIIDGTDTDYYNLLGVWSDPPPRGDYLLNTTPLGRYPLGATYIGSGTVFRVWAPHAEEAFVAGDFNGWNAGATPMQPVRGIWQAFVPGARPGQGYKFVFRAKGETLWRTDPRSRRQENSQGNSVIADPAYTWHDGDWVTPHFEDMIIYELHVGTFSGEGDGVDHFPGTFRDVVDRHLDYLVALGVTMIELMPIGEFAGDRSWGYNPVFLYAPESAYGAPSDLRYLVDRCHQAGVGVILDVVYNHLGASDLAGNLLLYDGEELYFYPPDSPFRETPWGPRPDFGKSGVRSFLLENLRYYLQEFHVDGFRLDGTDFIKVNADGWRFLIDAANTADSVSRKAIVIAEQLPNDPFVTLPVEEGGAGIDAQYSDVFHDNLRQAIRDAAFGDPSMTAVAAGLNHFGLRGVVNYIESHDEAHVHGRVCVEADRADPESKYAQGRSRVAAALVLFAAGIPMLLQGQEFLESRPFGDGPEERIRWQLVERHAPFFRFMKDAIRLRRTLPALRSSAYQNVYHVNDRDNVLAFHRWTDFGDDCIVVVSLANRGFDHYDLGFPQGGVWYELLNGDSAYYGGENRGNGGQIVASGPPLHGFSHSASLVVPEMAVLVFSRTPPQGGFIRGDCNGDFTVDIADAVQILSLLFQGADTDCEAACNANADSALDIADAVFLLSFLFAETAPPPAPYPGCSQYPSQLTCRRMCKRRRR